MSEWQPQPCPLCGTLMNVHRHFEARVDFAAFSMAVRILMAAWYPTEFDGALIVWQCPVDGVHDYVVYSLGNEERYWQGYQTLLKERGTATVTEP